MAELLVKDLRLRLGGLEVLKGVSLSLATGEVVALLGASGSGKTSLLRAIAGLEQPDSGSIVVDGKVFFDGAQKFELPAEKRGLGLVFQSYALWPHRTVFDNVGYGLKLRGAPPDEIRRRVDTLLSQIGLARLAERMPAQLSGGQQQRVAIARALIYEPPIILLDEPLSNLDAKLREEARAWLRSLITELGLSAIHVTHDQVEAMAIADRIVLLDAGMIAQDAPPTALYNDPATRFAAEFMGSNIRLNGKVTRVANGSATLDVFGARITGMARGNPSQGDDAAGIIRIERLRCTDAPGPNRLAMTLKRAMYLGERWELLFTRDELKVRVYAAEPPEPGEYYVEFPSDALWVFS